MKNGLLWCACVSALITMSGCKTQDSGSSVKIRDSVDPNKDPVEFYCTSKGEGKYHYAGFGMFRDQNPAKIYLETNHFDGQGSAPWANAVGKTAWAGGELTHSQGDLELYDQTGTIIGYFTYSGAAKDVEVVLALQENDAKTVKMGEGKGEFLDVNKKPVLSDLECHFSGDRALSAPRKAVDQPAVTVEQPATNPEQPVARTEEEPTEEPQVTKWSDLGIY